MNRLKGLIFFLILLVIGFVSASGDADAFNGTDALGVDDFDAGTLSADDVNAVSDSSLDDAVSSNGSSSLGADVSDDPSPISSSDSVSPFNDDEPDYDDYDYDEWDDVFDDADLGGFSSEFYSIITSNVSKYDFNDNYKVKVVDGLGRSAFLGTVDFYINHELAETTFVNFDGTAYFNLGSYINSSGTYDIVSMYSSYDGANAFVAHHRISVGDVPLSERDFQIYFENTKLYDPGENYSVRVVDINGNPVRKGAVYFVVYDRILYSNLTEDGIASVAIPADMNYTGNLLVWSFYTDGDLYELCLGEQISIGTRGLGYLDKSTIGSHFLKSWNNYSFGYADGKYIARVDANVYLVIELGGRVCLVREYNPASSADLMAVFSSLSQVSSYDLVQINLASGAEYVLNTSVWSDQEWDYTSRFAYGQLIINGNGSTIRGSDDFNFMYIGSDANVNVLNLTICNFDHCFINHGTLLCRDSIFRENNAYTLDVKLWGSGAVVHNYNTVLFDNCGFYNNTAKYMGTGILAMEGSILYAESNSLNLFKGFYGNFWTSCLFCDKFSTTIFYQLDTEFKFVESYIDVDAYFVFANSRTFNSAKEWVVNVSSVDELINVFNVLNSFVNCSNVTINMAPGDYVFSVNDYDRVRSFDWRQRYYRGLEWDTFYVIEDRYLLDVGLCPVTINGNGARILVSGNDDDDYHFANVGRYGVLALNNLTVSGFNSAFNVAGSVHCQFQLVYQQ